MYYAARIAKEKHPDAKVVFVGPCVAKRDVYKRQRVPFSDTLVFIFIQRKPELHHSAPVSYTHLDVYKRQVPPLAKTAALTASKLENIVASLNSEVIAVAAVSESFVGVKPVPVSYTHLIKQYNLKGSEKQEQE